MVDSHVQFAIRIGRTYVPGHNPRVDNSLFNRMMCFAAALFVLTFRTADVVPVSIIFLPEVLDQRMNDIGRYIWQYRRDTIFFVYGDGDASAKGSHHCTSLIVYLLDTLESFEWNIDFSCYLSVEVLRFPFWTECQITV